MSLLLPAAALAQGTVQWVDFPPAQSRLSFDAPGLSGRPGKAQEGMWVGSGKNNVRRFAYLYPSGGGGRAFATVVVFSINAETTFFNAIPDFDTLVPTLYTEFQNKPLVWDDAGRQAGTSPLGATGYRRFTALGRSCVSFGGLYGGIRGSGYENGSTQVGSDQILGYYCAADGHRLSAEDAALVLSRLGFEGLGKPQGPAPSGFAASAAAPVANDAPLASAEMRRQVALVWEGHPGPINASLTFDPKAATARLSVTLPGEDKDCTGIAHTAKDNTGTWSVQCPSGAYAGGTFRGLGRGKGSMGEGRDNKGAKIAFTVAGE
ncbi:hypothetical protein [Ferrovibrio sp.]|uniref:hypothetical protein n=1 Tax=Ferrovibrio sp. TaxID=1917215 RepID=UPI00311D6B32